MSKIELKAIKDLAGLSFCIPDYQRRYRWTKDSVTALLKDIDNFNSLNNEDFYCLQPLVIKEIKKDNASLAKELNSILKEGEKGESIAEKLKNISLTSKWEVVDGQQRLTTIYILLKELREIGVLNKDNFYSIEYKKNNNFNIPDNESEKDIDSFYRFRAQKTISSYFNQDKDKAKNFLNILQNKVKFIWYEIDEEENPINVFNRLNIGKISLSNAELIKALFLNTNNYSNEVAPAHKKKEIASQWDQIEYQLQDDEFWLFLNPHNTWLHERPTRIDFIFDLVKEALIDKTKADSNIDGVYSTFNFFYKYFMKKENKQKKDELLDLCWNYVNKYFQTFVEWFNDLELYHYIGFLIEQKVTLDNILVKWEGTTKGETNTNKIIFKNHIKNEIKRIINSIGIDTPLKEKIFDDKKKWKPLLLLHNIQTVINQNIELKNQNKYRQSVFYKFPFHLYKKEKWDVEHIAPVTPSNLDKKKDQDEWLECCLLSDLLELTQENIRDYLKNRDKNKDFDEDGKIFKNLAKDITEFVLEKKLELDEKNKNKIWNFVLLDSSSNRSYKNALFAVKRRFIIGKDQGCKWIFNSINKEWSMEKRNQEDNKEGLIAFVPPVTKNVFLKYYSGSRVTMREWSKEDAEKYLNNIKDTLKEFLNPEALSSVEKET